ncbi:heavy metal translocating P-type ATPase, partial [Pseudomonas sp. MWU12-2534b]
IVNALRASMVRRRSAEARQAEVDVDTEQLKREHAELSPLLGQIRDLADRIPKLPGEIMTSELADVIDSLEKRLLPHEKSDEINVYPRLASLLGGEDPLAAMSGANREIFKIVRSLRQMVTDMPHDGPDVMQMQAIQRLLYGLDAIVRLHCAQEEELFHAVEADV